MALPAGARSRLRVGMVVQRTETLPLRASDDVVRVRQHRARCMPSISASAWSIRRRSSRRRASWPATPWIYGGGGTARLESSLDGGRRGLRVVFEDKGPGIADIEHALADGFTTRPWSRPGAGRRPAAVERFRHRVARRRGHARDHHAMEMSRVIRHQRERPQRHGGGSPARDLAGRHARIRRARRRPRGAGGHRGSRRTSSSTPVEARSSCRALANGEKAGPAAGIGILALDRGPGISDLDAAFRDGYSSAGSPGTGLGAIRRASSEFDVYSDRALPAPPSSPCSGRCAPRRMRRAADAPGRRGVDRRNTARSRSAEMPGPSADDSATAVRSILVVDGLGHGPGAFDAAREACRLFREDPVLAPRGVDGAHPPRTPPYTRRRRGGGRDRPRPRGASSTPEWATSRG